MEEVARWILKPVSFEELSCQLKSISLEEAAEATRLEGAAGTFLPLPPPPAGLPAWTGAVQRRLKTTAGSKRRNGADAAALGERRISLQMKLIGFL
jgi:hypothetical protein